MNQRVLKYASDNIYAAQITQGLKGCSVHQLEKLPKKLGETPKEITGLLKRDFLEIGGNQKSDRAFLDDLFDSLKGKRNGKTHKKFLQNIIKKLTKNPEIKEKMQLLAKKENLDIKI